MSASSRKILRRHCGFGVCAFFPNCRKPCTHVLAKQSTNFMFHHLLQKKEKHYFFNAAWSDLIMKSKLVWWCLISTSIEAIAGSLNPCPKDRTCAYIMTLVISCLKVHLKSVVRTLMILQVWNLRTSYFGNSSVIYSVYVLSNQLILYACSTMDICE